MSEADPKREISVSEAGRRGGMKTAAKYGADHYQRIGREGGRRVKELVEKGRRTEERDR